MTGCTATCTGSATWSVCLSFYLDVCVYSVFLSVIVLLGILFCIQGLYQYTRVQWSVCLFFYASVNYNVVARALCFRSVRASMRISRQRLQAIMH